MLLPRALAQLAKAAVFGIEAHLDQSPQSFNVITGGANYDGKNYAEHEYDEKISKHV